MNPTHSALLQEIFQLPFVSADPSIAVVLNLHKRALDGHWRILSSHPQGSAFSDISTLWLQDLVHSISSLTHNVPSATPAWLATHLFEELAELLYRFRSLRLSNNPLFPDLAPFLIQHT